MNYVEERMGRLLGEAVVASYGLNDCAWWELKLEGGITWTMVDQDLSYSDTELIEKFVRPVKAALEKQRRQV